METVVDRKIYKIVRIEKKTGHHSYLSKMGKRWLPIKRLGIAAKLTFDEAELFINTKRQTEDAKHYTYYKEVV